MVSRSEGPFVVSEPEGPFVVSEPEGQFVVSVSNHNGPAELRGAGLNTETP